MTKRLISTGVGIIILVLVMISNNIYIFNIALTIIAMLGISEFYNAFKCKAMKPISSIGYVITLSLFLINYDFVDNEKIRLIVVLIFPILLLILFTKSVFSNMKNNIQDIAVTLLGIMYIPFFLMFLTLTRQLENGEYFVWYVLAGAWVTDSFAYLIGSKFGKHKFSKISPNKSIEGAIAGIIGSAIFYGVYTYYLTKLGIEFNCITMVVVGIVVSIISQIGDLAASSIKRYCGIKDFGTVMPGHGGVLDRFDSIIMISPFVYMFLQFLI